MHLLNNFILALLFLFSASQCSNNSSGGKATEIPNDTSEIVQSDSNTVPSSPPQSRISLPEWPVKEKLISSRIYPFDEGPLRPDFKAFRDTFYQAVVQKDLKELMRMISDDIKVSLGGEAGKADFMQAWALHNNPETSTIWKELAAILELGGAFSQYEEPPVFMAPYVFVTRHIEDPYEQGIVTGENVRLREGPTSKSKIIGSLTYDKVKIIQDYANAKDENIDGETHRWMQVELADGRKGFVYGKYLRNPVELRTVFQKKDGRWMLASLLAGD